MGDNPSIWIKIRSLCRLMILVLLLRPGLQRRRAYSKRGKGSADQHIRLQDGSGDHATQSGYGNV